MSGKNMVLDVIVRLKDKLFRSGLRRLTRKLNGIGKVARKLTVLGTALAAISFLGPVQEAAAFQQKLLDIAGTAELTGDAAFAFVERTTEQYERLALRVGQASDTIATGAGEMIAAGLDPKLVDASLEAIGRASTGANAEFSDMAKVATSLLQTLKLPAADLEDALGGLVKAGKEGAFELKDMARFFPTLTSQTAKFGVKGREAVNFLAAALQIARKGTSDPSSAANNLKNFLSKVLAPRTIKNFKELGVDIQSVMLDATTKGINPIEAVIQKITKLTGASGKQIEGLMARAKRNGLEGADALGFVREQLEKIHGAGKLGKLFQDQQVLDFLIPFLANIDEFKRIKGAVANAGRDAITADFDTQMQGSNRQLTVFRENLKQLSRAFGNIFTPWLSVLNAGIKLLRDFDELTGGVASKILSASGGILALAAAIGALSFLQPVMAAGFAALGAALGFLLTPVGLVVAALVAGATLIWKNWNKIGPPLKRLWNGLKRGLGKIKDAASDLGRSVSIGFNRHSKQIKKNVVETEGNMSRFGANMRRLGAVLAKFTGLDKVADDFGKLGTKLAGMIGLDFSKVNSLAEALGELHGWITRLASAGLAKVTGAIADFTGALADLAEQISAGASWEDILPPDVVNAFNGFKKAAVEAKDFVIKTFFEMVDWFAGLPGRILDAIGSIDIASLIKWPSLPAWLGGGSASGGSKPNGGIDTGKAANSNVPGKQSSLAKPARRQLAAAVAPVRQEVAVGGNITIKVDGPGKVTSAQTANKAVPINRGRAVGRV